jgi:hypothetical protein
MMTNANAATAARAEATDARARMRAYVGGLTDDQLLAGVVVIGGGGYDVIGPEKARVRAELLGEYERRHGGDAVDVVMDSIGL